MKVGVVVVTHYGLGKEFVDALNQILPTPPDFHVVPVDPSQSVDDLRNAIAKKLAVADEGKGVLVLTDMFGGTPSNLSLSFMKEHRVDVVSGLNLPMLIKLAKITEDMPLEELAPFIKKYGRRNIKVASEILPDDEP